MNRTFIPSLKDVVLVKIASALWNNKNLNDTDSDWEEIESEVTDKVSLLPLPELLKGKILSVIKPIGKEVQKWMRDKRHYDIDENFLDELFWTPQGTLDRKKTAEAKMMDETTDITKRYVLACNYCLENDVRALWEKMSESQKTSFSTENHRFDEDFFDQHPLVLFWTETMKGKEAKMEKYIDYIQRHNVLRREECTLYQNQYTFEDSVKYGSKLAAEYFWNKLDPEEKKESFTNIVYEWIDIDWIIQTDAIDSLPFLLSQGNEEQQLEMFETCPLSVLLCFLEWPRQNMFIEMTNHVWEFLDDGDYYSLLDKIVDKIYQGYKDYDYENLFKFTWQKSDIARKKYTIIRKCVKDSLLFHLLEMKCIKSVSLIFKDATIEEKENIFFHDDSLWCERLVRNKEWDVLKFFIIECVPSLEKIIKFKDKCKQNSTWTKHLNEEDLEIFYQLLEDFIQKWNEKRSTEQNNSSERLRSSSNE